MIEIGCRLMRKAAALDVTVQCGRLFAMGFTSRDVMTLEKILQALKENGVSLPESYPTIYELSPELLAASGEVSVVGSDTNGEVEYLIVLQDGEIYIGVGSDHADKRVERTNIHKSKQLCQKHMCRDLWPYDEIKGHWDQLRLRSWYTVNGKEVLYQDDTANVMQPPQIILGKLDLSAQDGELPCSVIFSGSIPTITGNLFGEHFRYELYDPVLDRQIGSSYSVRVIDEV